MPIESPSESGNINNITRASKGTRMKLAISEKITIFLFFRGASISGTVSEKPMPSILESIKINAARTPMVWRKFENEVVTTISSP
jgi:hypothetical protein